LNLEITSEIVYSGKEGVIKNTYEIGKFESQFRTRK